MFKNIVIIAMGATIAVWVFGCAPSALDNNWGRSYESAKYNQILNPEAGKNLDPVEGLEGPAAERAIKDHFGGKAPKRHSPPEAGAGAAKK
jgi:hypothetical protein